MFLHFRFVFSAVFTSKNQQILLFHGLIHPERTHSFCPASFFTVSGRRINTHFTVKPVLHVHVSTFLHCLVSTSFRRSHKPVTNSYIRVKHYFLLATTSFSNRVTTSMALAAVLVMMDSVVSA